jgi:molecular chaperone DnaJ
MNLKEAYSILEIPQTATPEEAKKKYRELTKKYHPDVNKEAGAEDKFKKINEAYQVVSTGKSTDREEMHWQNQSGGFDPFGNMRQQFRVHHHIELRTTLNFKDSILGCKQKLKFNRKTKCTHCNGAGQVLQNNGCEKCGGQGRIMIQQGTMVMIQTCDKCYGRVQSSPCTDCKSEGTLEAEASIDVTIPGGVQTGNVLRLSGMGNFAGSMMGFDQHTDVHLHLNVTPDPDLRLDGQHVVSDLEISLIEALQGCKKTVKTIMGDKDITIGSKSKNKDEVLIPRLGVNRIGNQRVILNVKYPENIDRLIDFLGEEK